MGYIGHKIYYNFTSKRSIRLKKNYDESVKAVKNFIRDSVSKVKNPVISDRGAGWFSPEYFDKGIEIFLKDKFSRDTRLSQLPTECDVTVYSYDIENDETYCFNNKEADPNHGDDSYVWQAARATSAAPTFFPGLEVFNSNSGLRFGTYDSSALAVYNKNNEDKLYLVWRGVGDGKDKIYYASFDGKNRLNALFSGLPEKNNDSRSDRPSIFI